MSIPPPSGAGAPEVPRCYTHTDRVAGSVCRRCGRPICPDCMREAPVGWQCANCVHEGHRQSPVVRWRPSRGVVRLGNTRVTPVVIALIAVNVVAYLYEQNHPAFEVKYSLLPFAVRYDHRWYELITSAFLHLSTTHIILNMISLAIVGPAVEAEIGRVRFLVLYLLSAVGGSVGFYLLAPANKFGLGASGAIFGLMGAYFVISRLRGYPSQQIVGLLALNALFSLSRNVAWQDHLGGFIAGCLVALGLIWTPRKSARPSELAQFVQGLAVVIASAVAMVLLLQIPPGHVNL